MKFAKCKSWLLKQGYREEEIIIKYYDGCRHIFTTGFRYYACETTDSRGRIFVAGIFWNYVNTQAEVIELWEKLGEK